MSDIDFVVCAAAPLGEPLLMAGNLTADCSRCGQRIQYRPHAPKGPPKICAQCAVSDPKFNEAEVVISPKTRKELDDYLRRTKQ